MADWTEGTGTSPDGTACVGVAPGAPCRRGCPSTGPGRVSGRPEPARSRAVLVGVSTYGSLDGLPAVANNLEALAAALSSSTAWGLPERNCVVVAEPRHAHQVSDLVWQAAQEATDTLLVYYSGHGLLDGRGDLFLALPHSRPGLSHTCVAYQGLREIITSGRAQRYVLILDRPCPGADEQRVRTGRHRRGRRQLSAGSSRRQQHRPRATG